MKFPRSALLKHIEELEKQNEELKKQNEELEKKHKHGDKRLFRDIVKDDTGCEVKRATPEQLEEAKMNAILARNYQIDVNNNIFKDKSGKPRERYNECGNDMELVLKESTNGKLIGLGKSSGYPDLVNPDQDYYLECKMAAKKSLDSSFRSFYLSTLDKITESRAHILVCFKHHNGKLSKDDEPIVIDLYDLELTLKCEWESNNKEMYLSTPKKPDYTIEELNEIKGTSFDEKIEGKPQKNIKKTIYSKMCKEYGLPCGGKCEDLYQRLVDYLN
tara:strand:+ start:416 stop:1237 length:822 start_codon:yes stop_codon:yes gene_type:complete